MSDRPESTQTDRTNPRLPNRIGRSWTNRYGRGLLGVAGSAALIGVAALAFGLVPAPRVRASTAAPATITVTGSGQITVPPTQADLVLGTQVEAGSAQTALSEESLRMKRILAALAKIPVPRSDIETQGYSIQPNQNQSGNVTGFTVADTLSITLSKPSLAAEVLDRAVAAGANQVQSVNFTGPNSPAQEQQAEALALANAHAQASAAATRLGLTVGTLKSLSLEPNSGLMTFGGLGIHAAAAYAPAIVPPAGVTVSSTANVTYALVP